jgi:hypothetical protein
MKKGLILAALQVALVLSLTAKYVWDREHLPRAWARTINYDPNLPVRGRYVSLRIVVNEGNSGDRVLLNARDGNLVAVRSKTGLRVIRFAGGPPTLAEPVAFFLPEHAPDPTRLQPGEELWVELSVPPEGSPRPLSLAVRKAQDPENR